MVSLTQHGQSNRRPRRSRTPTTSVTTTPKRARWRAGPGCSPMILLSLAAASLHVAARAFLSDGLGPAVKFFDLAPSYIQQNHVKKRSGQEWTVWNHEEAIPRGYWDCSWATFTATNGRQAQMCLHPVPDLISNNIRRKGRWEDCDGLTSAWVESRRKHSATEDLIYLEIGANIGSCVLQMLLTTNATIMAFEPHPRNQFCLTSTLMRLDADLRNRVTFFPIALGASAGSSEIYTATSNHGNAIVGKMIKDFAEQTFAKPIPIQIERLDSVLGAGRRIPLMKMDAQGYECQILEGMGGEILGKISAIHFEVDNHFLASQNCSDFAYLDTLRTAGFDTFWIRGNGRHQLIKGPTTKHFSMANFLAKKAKRVSKI